ncbi:hypothetical protein B0A53_05270, partial [Rhodotorula sp. CCFEE 5036]
MRSTAQLGVASSCSFAPTSSWALIAREPAFRNREGSESRMSIRDYCRSGSSSSTVR